MGLLGVYGVRIPCTGFLRWGLGRKRVDTGYLEILRQASIYIFLFQISVPVVWEVRFGVEASVCTAEWCVGLNGMGNVV